MRGFTILCDCMLSRYAVCSVSHEAKLWNSLGTEAKNSSTLRAFKREVQK